MPWWVLFCVTPFQSTAASPVAWFVEHGWATGLIRPSRRTIIQAPDMLPDGRADMCDSCPDMTVYDGKLINSCRMDEYRLFGGFLSVVEKSRVEAIREPLGQTLEGSPTRLAGDGRGDGKE